jgi:Protein of unknown function (DUF3592)
MRTLFKLFGYVALLVVPLLAVSLWLDAHGETATGTVTGKREEIRPAHEPTGGWYSRRYLLVDFPRLARTGLRGTIWVDSVDFASIRLGDRVGVQYFSCCPIYARLAGHSTPRVTWEAIHEFASDPLLDWAFVGIVALTVAARIASPLVVGTGVAWLGAAVLFLFPERPLRVPSGTEVPARVAKIALVDESPEGTRHRSSSSSHPERLRVPYQVVQLRFVPAGAADSALAVDEVDAGSVPSLALGAVVKVRYQPEAPRDAMLVEGSRTFRQRNRFHFLFLVLGLSVIGTAAGLVWRLRGRRRLAAP